MVELIVVIAIVAILSGMMFLDYGKFKSSTSLQNLADDIALSVRKAQMYAVGAHGTNNDTGVKSFNYGYGVHFTLKENSNLFQGSNKSFVIFVDIKITGNHLNGYDIIGNSITCGDPATGIPTDSNECLEMLNITGADYISSIKYDSAGTEISNDDTIDIIFKRPNTAPVICFRSNGSGNGVCDKSQVEITVKNDNSGTTKTVTIYNNGQISVS